MEINKPIFIMPLLGVSVLLLLSLFAVPAVPTHPTDSDTSHSPKVKSSYCYTVDRADGTHEDYGCTPNVVYDDGLDDLMETLIDTTASANYTQIAVCNATLATERGCGTPQGDQSEDFYDFAGCGLDPVTGSVATLGTGNRSIWTTFTSSCDSQVTNATMLRDTATQRNFSGNLFTAVTLNTNDQLTVNITLFAVSG